MAWNATQQILIARAQALLQPQLVLGALAAKSPLSVINAQASTVKVAVTGAVASAAYTPGSDLTINNLATTTVDIDLDTKRAFGFSIDMGDAQMSGPALADLLDKAIAKGIYAVADDIEDELSAYYTAGVQQAATTSIDKTDILDFVGKAKSALRTAGALGVGSWLVLPDILEPALLSALSALPQSPTAVLSTGYVGTLFGLDIYISTKLSDGNATPQRYALAGCPDAITYAGAVTALDRVPMEKQFGDSIKGLYVFGSAVTNPSGLLTFPVAI